ncbi:MAG: hypothetical protein DHS20C14_16380 [Phycisphaeraceae bacterium]|nr:MAG: hypothetical protein DHS20C14_16380 [Phycisphaeraceae bacterium]
MSASATQIEPRPLATLRRGATGTVAQVNIDGPDRALLDSMGLRISARVRVCHTGRTCVVVAEGADRCPCRLGLERRLAERVMIAPATA